MRMKYTHTNNEFTSIGIHVKHYSTVLLNETYNIT